MHRRILTSSLLSLLLASAAIAQVPRSEVPKIEVAGGYTFLRDPRIDANAHGWVGSVTHNRNRSFGVIGEVEGNYARTTISTLDADLSLYAFLAGAQFTEHNPTNATPFLQLLVGGTHARNTIGGIRTSSSGFAFQPGVGVDFWLSPALDLRFGGHYRRFFDTGANQFQFRIALVWKSGIVK